MTPSAMPAPEPSDPLMKFSDLLGLTVQLNNRLDMLWQRVIYSHVGMVGVLVFFASANYPFVVPRLLVVFFYSMNALVTYLAFREAYRGLRATVADLRDFPGAKGHVFDWAQSQNYDMHAARRAAILIVLWLMISYLILGPLIPGLT